MRRTARRVPVIRDRPEWDLLRPSRMDAEWDAPKDYTVSDTPALRDALTHCYHDGGGVIELEPGIYHGGIKINTPWFARPQWTWADLIPRILLRGKGSVVIEGIAWQSGQGEFWTDNIGVMCGQGGTSAIGTAGQVGAWRSRNMRLLQPPYQAGAYGGTGTKWGARFYGGLLQMESPDWTAPVQEHGLYLDNMAGLVLTGTPRFGPAGRTHIQTGTRQDFPAPEYFLGVYIENFHGEGLHSGAGGGAGLTIYGYDGPVEINGFVLHSESQGQLARNRALSIWRPSNYGGTIPTNDDEYATDRATLLNVLIDYPGMYHPALEAESLRVLYLGEAQGNCPKWRLDAPDQYPSGELGQLCLVKGTDQHGLGLPDVPTRIVS